ncbi:MAG: topoisomerase, partial [Alphaproteobacteria bacterium]|nr:topoisomerase [Alphaproteobacteria bacterium]
MRDLTVSEIAAAAAARAEAITRNLLPAGKLIGKECCCGSIRGEPGESLHVCLVGDKAGIWKDFNEGHGGDLIDLAKQVLCTDTGDAVRWIKEQIGLGNSLDNGTNGAAHLQPAAPNSDAGWQPITPIPMDAGKAPVHRLGKSSQRWPYRDADGNVLMWVCRWDTPDGKEIRPLTYWRRTNGSQGLEWKHLPAPRPLYGLDQLARMSGASVHLVEGEKTAEAAQKPFPEEPCITWPGGTNAVSKADWSPLKDSRVLIWPDSDEPGSKAAE